MSPRAACRLERLGFAEVHDYVGGKMDWLSADLPYEGEATLVSRNVRRDPILAGLDDPADQLGDRLIADPAGLAVIVADDIVQGIVRGQELANATPDATAEQVMRFDITTVRPGTELEPLLERMDRAGMAEVVVTRGDGTLVGVLTLGAVQPPESGSSPRSRLSPGA